MKRSHKLYGLFVFCLLHDVNLLVSIEKMVNQHCSGLYGRDIGYMPDAKRVYLALCKAHNVKPEAGHVA